MEHYKRFLIQKQNQYLNDGTTANDTTVHDSDEWGIRITKYPFKVKGDAKDVPSNDWFDEHGKETFLPDTLPIKAYETTVELVFKGTKKTAGTKIKSFIDYLANGGYFKMYCEWCVQGLQNIRYISYDPNAEYLNMDDSDTTGIDVITFKVKLGVDDPETYITLAKE
jgi:hypothetical protein